MTTPVFLPLTTSPPGLNNTGSRAKPVLVDIDNDGNVDAFVGNGFGTIEFFKNTSTGANLTFAASNLINFGDVGSNAAPTFADIDDDGDLDAFVGNSAGNIRFFENIGTASNPNFAAPVTNKPFGLGSVNAGSATPTFVDIDDDGDFDFFGGGNNSTHFYENIGTATNPAFAKPIINPFGLAEISGFNASPTFADTDGDGDLDAWIGGSDGIIWFFENIGSVTTASFTTPAPNKASLDFPGADDAKPSFGDLDGDGDLDAIVGTRLGNLSFFENTVIGITVTQTKGSTAVTEGGPVVSPHPPSPTLTATAILTLLWVTVMATPFYI